MMTKEEKAREIIRQGGKCDRVGCAIGLSDECPCYNECSETNGTNESHPSKILACKRFLGPDIREKSLVDEFAMAAMEAIIVKLPVEVSVEGDGCFREKAVALGSYDYAAAMMAERAKRDEMGNVKETK